MLPALLLLLSFRCVTHFSVQNSTRRSSCSLCILLDLRNHIYSEMRGHEGHKVLRYAKSTMHLNKLVSYVSKKSLKKNSNHEKTFHT